MLDKSILLTSLPQLSPRMGSDTSYQKLEVASSPTRVIWSSTRDTHSPTVDWSAWSKRLKRSISASHGIFPRWDSLISFLNIFVCHQGTKLFNMRSMDYKRFQWWNEKPLCTMWPLPFWYLLLIISYVVDQIFLLRLWSHHLSYQVVFFRFQVKPKC